MGVRLPPGTVTLVPVGGTPRTCDLGSEGQIFSDNGVEYAHKDSPGIYRRRNPPPLGPWVYFEFDGSGHYAKYEQDAGTLLYINTELGTYVHNG